MRRVQVWFVPTGGQLPSSLTKHQDAASLPVEALGCPNSFIAFRQRAKLSGIAGRSSPASLVRRTGEGGERRRQAGPPKQPGTCIQECGGRHRPLMRNREEIEFEFSFVASSAVWTEKRGRASSGRLIQIGGMDFFISFRFASPAPFCKEPRSLIRRRTRLETRNGRMVVPGDHGGGVASNWASFCVKAP